MKDHPRAKVQPVQFPSFSNEPAGSYDEQKLSLLLDVPLEIAVELGRTTKKVRDIMEWKEGAVIEVQKLAGEPVDVLLNRQFMAKGEVVVLDDNFAIRITDIISQKDRVKTMK